VCSQQSLHAETNSEVVEGLSLECLSLELVRSTLWS